MNEIYGRNQYQPSPYAMNMYSRPASGNQITWVMGIENAKTYPLAPNSTVLLMDSEAPKFYIKTADMNGMCTLTAYEFAKAKEPTAPTAAPVIDADKYLTKEEFYNFIKANTAAAAEPQSQQAAATKPNTALI